MGFENTTAWGDNRAIGQKTWLMCVFRDEQLRFMSPAASTEADIVYPEEGRRQQLSADRPTNTDITSRQLSI